MSAGARLRVGALCIGIENYSHLTDVDCAVRDAQALDVRINATPFCSSSCVRHTRATGSSQMLLRAIRTQLQDLAAGGDATFDFFLLYYGGHVVHLASGFDPLLLQETKAFLVPANVSPKSSEDCMKSCLAVSKVLNVLRKDLCAPVRTRFGRKIPVLVVLDSHRRVLQNGTALAHDFSSCTAPESTAIFVSHQRKVANHEREMSPFIRACLDPQNGLLADNIRVSQVLQNLLCKGEDAAVVGLDDIPENFCCVVPEEPPDISMELRTLLQNWKLEGQAHILIRHGVLDVAGLEAMQLQDVDSLGLGVRFRILLEHVQQVAALRNAQKKSTKQKQHASSSSKSDETAGIEDCGMGDDIDMGAVALLRADNTTPGADAFVRTLDKLKEESDVKSIVEGMLMYAQEKGVQEACARALAALASGAQENLNLMIEHGVVQRTVCAMRMHPDAVDVQEACCELLGSFAANKDLEMLIVFAGGIEQTVAAMQSHAVLGVRETACKTLRALSMTSTANQIHITRAGGVKGILLALSSVEQLLHTAACAALLALNCTPALDLMLAGGVPHKVKNIISLPNVGDDLKRMGKELLDRLKAEAISISSPISPVKGARIGNRSLGSALTLENPTSRARHVPKPLSHEDGVASAMSPSSSSSSPSPKSLQKLSRRRAMADYEPPPASRSAMHSFKTSHTVLRLPKVESGRAEVGLYGLGKSLQSAGSKAKEMFASAGIRMGLSSFPVVGSVTG